MEQPITKVTSGNSCEISVRGRIDGNLANQLEIEILAAIRDGANEIFVNLAQADYICSAGLRVLLQYFRQMKNNKKSLYVTRPSSGIEAILDQTGFKSLIVEGQSPR
jgi:anti-sigma B factor antagonist